MEAILPSTSFSQHSFQSILEEVVKVAKEAGQIIMEAVNTNNDSNVHLKGRIDLVTDTGVFYYYFMFMYHFFYFYLFLLINNIIK